MQERIIEIIIHILSEIKTRKKNLQDVDLKKLEKLGFSNSEMKAALSWLFNKIYLSEFDYESSSIETSPHSHRFLHEIEKMAITSEAYGYLIQLRELNIINDSDIELIIDKILLSNMLPVDIDEMKSIVSQLVFETDEESYGRFPINDNETIN